MEAAWELKRKFTDVSTQFFAFREVVGMPRNPSIKVVDQKVENGMHETLIANAALKLFLKKGWALVNTCLTLATFWNLSHAPATAHGIPTPSSLLSVTRIVRSNVASKIFHDPGIQAIVIPLVILGTHCDAVVKAGADHRDVSAADIIIHGHPDWILHMVNDNVFLPFGVKDNILVLFGVKDNRVLLFSPNLQLELLPTEAAFRGYLLGLW
ncbi:hypothetical protein BDP27DRAFT_1401100 [Rhodocollybia butyracea]|uniref:Uncharacterized protein n=1 Tax=Rhodocollybia butyracea TaxID=206335 RepID=A0A9P5U9F2_9AGAR|nr:hypothetical protein BDP27DRAFT_1401100 [Rhodocollybia butyracea]